MWGASPGHPCTGRQSMRSLPILYYLVGAWRNQALTQKQNMRGGQPPPHPTIASEKAAYAACTSSSQRPNSGDSTLAWALRHLTSVHSQKSKSSALMLFWMLPHSTQPIFDMQ